MVKKVGSLPGGRCSLLATAMLAALALPATAQWEQYAGPEGTRPDTSKLNSPSDFEAVGYPGWLATRLPTFGRRHIGWGRPLEGTSWRNRPIYFGWTVGGLFGQPVISGYLDQGDDLFGSYVFGYDFNYYWGTEARLAFGYLGATYLPEQISASSVENTYADLHLLYYPWGDSRWRPFASLGMGLAGFHFQDRLGRGVSETVFGLPLGFGLKYQWRHWMTVRMEVKDNISFGDGDLNTMHNWSITAGLEAHWGGDESAKYRPW
jgi:hypothetical protein